MCTNLLVGIAYFLCPDKWKKIKSYLTSSFREYRWNIYIRYFMISYFNLCIFSLTKIIEPRENDINDTRRMLTITAYVIFTLVILLPLICITVVCSRFDLMKIKEAKASFNTLILKVDKQSRYRLMLPFLYFMRRLAIALLLAIPTNFSYLFLQYVFTLMITHIYVLYLVSQKPY